MINSETDHFLFISVYVVVNLLSRVIFVFLLFLGMTMFANKVETRRKIKITREIKN